MRLRRPCKHVDSVHPDGHYEPHKFGFDQHGYWGAESCPGGESLPEDALVIEKQPAWAELEMVMRPHTFDHDDAADAALNAKAWFLTLADQVGEPR